MHCWPTMNYSCFNSWIFVLSVPTVVPDGVRVTAVGESTVVLRWNSVNDPSITAYKVCTL